MAKKKKNCPLCGAEVNKENLDRHLQRVHGQVVEEEIEEKESKKSVGTGGKKKKTQKEGKRVSRKRTPKNKSRENVVIPIIILISFIIIVSLVGVVIYYNLNQNDESNEETTNNGNGGNGGGGKPVAIMATTLGTIKIELDTDNAPATAQNFIDLANSGFYDGLIYHRVISDFMIQGGGFTQDGTHMSAAQIPWENTGLKNLKYTVAMARSGDANNEADSGTASSQFFINTVDNPNLDNYAYPYVVFGKVIDGFNVVESIEALPTGDHDGHQNWPDDPPVITGVAIDY